MFTSMLTHCPTHLRLRIFELLFLFLDFHFEHLLHFLFHFLQFHFSFLFLSFQLLQRTSTERHAKKKWSKDGGLKLITILCWMMNFTKKEIKCSKTIKQWAMSRFIKQFSFKVKMFLCFCLVRVFLCFVVLDLFIGQSGSFTNNSLKILLRFHVVTAGVKIILTFHTLRTYITDTSRLIVVSTACVKTVQIPLRSTIISA